MAKVGKFCLAKRVKVEWLFHNSTAIIEFGILNVDAGNFPFLAQSKSFE